MHTLVISFSHKNCDISTRELLSINADDKLHSFYNNLLESSDILEAIILSTCNRVEVILYVTELVKTKQIVINELHKYSDIDYHELDSRADIYENDGAIHHLFSVASSLDSLVIGETQITGQLKDAYKFAKNHNYCDVKLSKIINFAFKCAADVRTSTTISKNPVSVASAAVSLADDLLNGLGGITAVVVGAGEMGTLAIKNLIKKGCNIILVNRDIKKAELIADIYNQNVTVANYSELPSLLNRYKLLFSATSAQHAIITQNLIQNSNFTRYWFDMAVPRDIDIIKNDTIKLHVVDDLQSIVSKNIDIRQQQASLAYKIIGTHTENFLKLLKILEIEPTIKLMRVKANECIDDELQKAIKKEFIPKELEDIVKKTLINSFNKFLHTPTNNLRNVSTSISSDSILETINHLCKENNNAKDN